MSEKELNYLLKPHTELKQNDKQKLEANEVQSSCYN